MDKSKNLYGHLFALTANVMWGLMSPIGKSALQEFSPISVTTFRMVGAAAAFWILSMFCKQEHVNHQDMLKIFFASLFALVFNQGVFIFGLSMTSPIDASCLATHNENERSHSTYKNSQYFLIGNRFFQVNGRYNHCYNR